jgi:hypothetical protein
VEPVVRDHALLVVTSDQHHPPPENKQIQINGTSIPPGTYTYNVALTYAGHKVARAILRGTEAVDIQGHSGVVAIGTDTAGQSVGISNRPFQSPGYTTSYMGGYSRLHGDSYISTTCFDAPVGGVSSYIVLKDIYISGTNLVLEFLNLNATSKTLYCYGSVSVK